MKHPPTLAPLAAPQGGASVACGGPARTTPPTLASLAAPQGARQWLGAARRHGPTGITSRERHRRQSGFSVLEVLVAFIIVGLVVTALFRLFGGALGNAAAADEWTRALLVAESRLTLAASAVPLRESADAGTDDGGRIAWRTTVTPYVPPDADPDLERLSQSMPTRLYRVSVDVRFPGNAGRERSLSLSTVRLGPRNPA